MKKIVLIILFLSFSGFVLFTQLSLAAHIIGVTDNISNLDNERHAWNDVISWIDFGHNPSIPSPNGSAVEVTNDRLLGYAYAPSVGLIALDCATSPLGNDCSSNYFVSNDLSGNLAGWAWNDNIGWISFCGNDSEGSVFNAGTWQCPTSPAPTYQVTISTTDPKEFSGWAWNDVVGWISFNCSNTSSCPPGGNTIDYKVLTTWDAIPPELPTGELVSSVFDTCKDNIDCGASLNTIHWTGSLTVENPIDSQVQFQIASSDCENGAGNPPTCNDINSWNTNNNCTTVSPNDSCFIGPGGSSEISPAPDVYVSSNFSSINGISEPIKITTNLHTNHRYFRYKIYLTPCNIADGCTSPETPVVDDVIINWSP